MWEVGNVSLLRHAHFISAAVVFRIRVAEEVNVTLVRLNRFADSDKLPGDELPGDIRNVPPPRTATIEPGVFYSWGTFRPSPIGYL